MLLSLRAIHCHSFYWSNRRLESVSRKARLRAASGPAVDNNAFCHLGHECAVVHNDLAVGFADGYAVVPGHHQVIPRRRVMDYWGLNCTLMLACHELLHELRSVLLQDFTASRFTQRGYSRDTLTAR
jgi:hypothetical protein